MALDDEHTSFSEENERRRCTLSWHIESAIIKNLGQKQPIGSNSENCHKSLERINNKVYQILINNAY